MASNMPSKPKRPDYVLVGSVPKSLLRGLGVKLLGVLLGATLVVGIVVSGLVSAQASHSPPKTCGPGVHFIGIRGSNQTTTDNGAYGPQVAGVLNAFQDYFGLRGIPVSFEAIDYTAPPVEDLFIDRNAYFSASESGAADAANQIRVRSEACPDQPVVLVGFSSGAMAAHIAAAGLSSEVKTNLAKVILIADPGRVSRSPTLRGTANRNSDGILGDSLADVPSDLIARTESWCNKGDMVCDPSSWLVKTARELVEAPPLPWGVFVTFKKVEKASGIHTSSYGDAGNLHDMGLSAAVAADQWLDDHPTAATTTTTTPSFKPPAVISDTPLPGIVDNCELLAAQTWEGELLVLRQGFSEGDCDGSITIERRELGTGTALGTNHVTLPSSFNGLTVYGGVAVGSGRFVIVAEANAQESFTRNCAIASISESGDVTGSVAEQWSQGYSCRPRIGLLADVRNDRVIWVGNKHSDGVHNDRTVVEFFNAATLETVGSTTIPGADPSDYDKFEGASVHADGGVSILVTTAPFTADSFATLHRVASDLATYDSTLVSMIINLGYPCAVDNATTGVVLSEWSGSADYWTTITDGVLSSQTTWGQTGVCVSDGHGLVQHLQLTSYDNGRLATVAGNGNIIHELVLPNAGANTHFSLLDGSPDSFWISYVQQSDQYSAVELAWASIAD